MIRLAQPEAYLITLGLEAAVAGLIAPLCGFQRRQAAATAVAASSFTHPLMWILHFKLFRLLGSFTTPLLEILVVIAEAPAYRVLAHADWRHAVALSILVNLGSWLFGFVLQSLP